MVNRLWPTAVAGEADNASSVSALACHTGGPNSVNPGQILLVYGTYFGIFSHPNYSHLVLLSVRKMIMLTS